MKKILVLFKKFNESKFISFLILLFSTGNAIYAGLISVWFYSMGIREKIILMFFMLPVIIFFMAATISVFKEYRQEKTEV